MFFLSTSENFNPISEGLDRLHALTSAKSYKLRIDLADFNGNHRFAEYASFIVGSSATKYTLTVGAYSGDAGTNFVCVKSKQKGGLNDLLNGKESGCKTFEFTI